MKAVATWEGEYRVRLNDGRGHDILADQPLDEEGTDMGTTPHEMLLQSLAGCIVTIFALVARRRRLPFESLRVDLDATRPPRSPTVTAVQGDLRVGTTASGEEVATALAITMRACPVGILFERAQIPIKVRPIVIAPVPGPAPEGFARIA